MVPPLKLSRFLSPGEDACLVLDAAALLDVREFDLFELAYDWWFGARAEIKALEKAFVPYMYRGIVPLWVRQYAREVMIEARSVQPDFLRLGIEGVRRVSLPPRNGKFIVAITVAGFAVLYAGLLDTVANWSDEATPDPRPISCAGGGPGSGFFESLAHTIAGKPPPAC